MWRRTHTHSRTLLVLAIIATRIYTTGIDCCTRIAPHSVNALRCPKVCNMHYLNVVHLHRDSFYSPMLNVALQCESASNSISQVKILWLVRCIGERLSPLIHTLAKSNQSQQLAEFIAIENFSTHAKKGTYSCWLVSLPPTWQGL